MSVYQKSIVIFSLFTSSNAFDCSFSSSYPRQYIAYRNFNKDLVIDGRLDDDAWTEVSFTENFVDISTSTIPHLKTNAKIRYDETFLYIGARMEEPQVAANITWTCHCNNGTGDQVIFHDNDFEIFVDTDGSNHYYKETEINAANMNGTSATWDLLLNKPYNDGGGENSSRTNGINGWDMFVPRDKGHCVTYTDGVLNDPTSHPTFWSAEIALPLSKLVELTTSTLPIKSGQFWRINFSRVEWALKVMNGKYQQYPSCQSCPVPGTNSEDNWVWSPQGAIAMHQPESWGFLQFSEDEVNTTKPVTNTEWPLRFAAMVAYYAQHNFSSYNNGTYAQDPFQLLNYTQTPEALNGSCFSPPGFILYNTTTGGPKFNASFVDNVSGLLGTITDDRYLRIYPIQ